MTTYPVYVEGIDIGYRVDEAELRAAYNRYSRARAIYYRRARVAGLTKQDARRLLVAAHTIYAVAMNHCNVPTSEDAWARLDARADAAEAEAREIAARYGLVADVEWLPGGAPVRLTSHLYADPVVYLAPPLPY